MPLLVVIVEVGVGTVGAEVAGVRKGLEVVVEAVVLVIVKVISVALHYQKSHPDLQEIFKKSSRNLQENPSIKVFFKKVQFS
jgi:hypothetical protein